MKKNAIIGMAMAIGILATGALSASAADACSNCTDQQAIQQFKQETDALVSTLNAKDLELRAQYGYDSIDTRKVNALESEIKKLKDMIDVSAAKHGISACSRS